MDIFKRWLSIRQWFKSPPAPEFDYMMDRWIREALVEYSAAQPSNGTWDRLCKAIAERQPRTRGMWILDEPLRDPPESLPTALTSREYRRAQRIYDGGQERLNYLTRALMWSDLMPGFSAMVNC